MAEAHPVVARLHDEVVALLSRDELLGPDAVSGAVPTNGAVSDNSSVGDQSAATDTPSSYAFTTTWQPVQSSAARRTFNEHVPRQSDTGPKKFEAVTILPSTDSGNAPYSAAANLRELGTIAKLYAWRPSSSRYGDLREIRTQDLRFTPQGPSYETSPIPVHGTNGKVKAVIVRFPETASTPKPDELRSLFGQDVTIVADASNLPQSIDDRVAPTAENPWGLGYNAQWIKHCDVVLLPDKRTAAKAQSAIARIPDVTTRAIEGPKFVTIDTSSADARNGRVNLKRLGVLLGAIGFTDLEVKELVETARDNIALDPSLPLPVLPNGQIQGADGGSLTDSSFSTISTN